MGQCILEMLSQKYQKSDYIRCIFGTRDREWKRSISSVIQECIIQQPSMYTTNTLYTACGACMCVASPFHVYRLSIITSYRDCYIIDKMCTVGLPCAARDHFRVEQQHEKTKDWVIQARTMMFFFYYHEYYFLFCGFFVWRVRDCGSKISTLFLIARLLLCSLCARLLTNLHNWNDFLNSFIFFFSWLCLWY